MRRRSSSSEPGELSSERGDGGPSGEAQESEAVGRVCRRDPRRRRRSSGWARRLSDSRSARVDAPTKKVRFGGEGKESNLANPAEARLRDKGFLAIGKFPGNNLGTCSRRRSARLSRWEQPWV